MSFILDALKKSENARQRQIGPAMAELPRRRRQSERPVWAFVVAGLLLMNIGVLGFVLARKKGDVQPVAAAAAAPTMAMAAPQQYQYPAEAPTVLPARQAIQLPPQQLPLPDPRSNNAGMTSSLAEESGTPNELDGDGGLAEAVAAAQTAIAQEETAQVRPIQAPSVAPLGSAGAQVRSTQPSNAGGGSGEILPTIEELSASGRTFPTMRLDIHSFADKPAERFVFVNMRKYGEGQTLQEGPAVERITQEGVILNQQGLRFLLPRP